MSFFALLHSFQLRLQLGLLWEASSFEVICVCVCLFIDIGIDVWTFPELVSSFFSRLSWPTLEDSSPSASGGNVIGNIPSYTGREVEASAELGKTGTCAGQKRRQCGYKHPS
ncbi:hypothetical protein IFM89_026698 [Coptis chinensis]|uniref:Uncharacterized protein n=1 Tax=Coptis chinensis TaxID=261450 RepID=A0A835H946_9MAGN|nr:hypothetical protein IFM89_026698 [Coptis chinensis]